MEKKVTEVPIQKKSEQKKKVGFYCRVSTATSAQIHSLSFRASYLLRHALNVKGWHVEDIYIQPEEYTHEYKKRA